MALKRNVQVGLVLAVALGAALVTGCKEDKVEAEAPARVAPPKEAPAPVPTAAVKAYAAKAEGSATFLIDAPLEKIKGKATAFRGSLLINPMDLKATSGDVQVDLKTLKTETFGDEGKDSAQTEHAHNWLGLGDDVPPKEREENQWVRFTIKSITSVSAANLDQAPEADGKRTVDIVAEGEVWLHGVTAPQTVKLTATFEGPAMAPTGVMVKSAEPLRVSLKHHDVKPRDIAGKFLQGALEKVGEKIVDDVQISVDFSAAPKN